METLVKLNGVPEQVLEIMLKKGYFKTKTEAIRAGLLGLAKEYNLLKSHEDLEAELVALKIRKTDESAKKLNKKSYTESEVKKKYGFK